MSKKNKDFEIYCKCVCFRHRFATLPPVAKMLLGEIYDMRAELREDIAHLRFDVMKERYAADPVVKAFNGLADAAKKAMEAIKPKCYISGAIAHHDLKERMDTFDRAAAVLEKSGYNPVNPFKNGVPQSEHWTKHMRRDIGLLVQCDYIYMLKGWELSKGAKLELDVASSCGIKVLFEK